MNILNAADIDFTKFDKAYPEHSKVIPAYAYADMVEDYFYGDQTTSGLTLPWAKTHSDIRLRSGEVSIWAGVNGHGKSLVTSNIMLHAIAQGEPVCIASMEMKPVNTMARMTRQACGSREPSREFIQAFHSWTEKRLWLYTQQGTVDSKRILSVLRYVNEALYHSGEKIRIKHFVIDSLMKCGINTDDYNRQKSFIDQLCAHAKDTGVHIHIVAHARKSQSEREIVDKFDVSGSADITNQVDNVFTVWRNKGKEEAIQSGDAVDESKPDALLICSKQRHGESEPKVALWFHPESMQYVAYHGARPIAFFHYSRETYAA
jgi:twinkle protein